MNRNSVDYFELFIPINMVVVGYRNSLVVCTKTLLQVFLIISLGMSSLTSKNVLPSKCGLITDSKRFLECLFFECI
jgi:hypothetical protein